MLEGTSWNTQVWVFYGSVFLGWSRKNGIVVSIFNFNSYDPRQSSVQLPEYFQLSAFQGLMGLHLLAP